MFNIKCIPCQVSTKDQDKERIASVEASKVKEVNLDVKDSHNRSLEDIASRQVRI